MSHNINISHLFAFRFFGLDFDSDILFFLTV